MGCRQLTIAPAFGPCSLRKLNEMRERWFGKVDKRTWHSGRRRAGELHTLLKGLDGLCYEPWRHPAYIILRGDAEVLQRKGRQSPRLLGGSVLCLVRRDHGSRAW